MASTSTAIEWTDKTWNPATGCTKVSPGCKHCYAETLTKRFTNHFENGFKFTIHPERLDQPRKWRKPSRIFVNSMSDLFHEEMPLEFLLKIFTVMNDCEQHTFQILTKRHDRMAELASQFTWTPNIWLGVSVENQNYIHRVESLRQTPASVKFLSCEPLLGPLRIDLSGIDWVITGGESGRGYRPIEEDWVRSIRDQCLISNVAFFHKQWGGLNPKSGGRLLDGITWDQYPLVEQTSLITVASD